MNENISNLKTPTLYLHGDKDSIVPISSGDELSRLANVKFITVSNSKHEILNQENKHCLFKNGDASRATIKA